MQKTRQQARSDYNYKGVSTTTGKVYLNVVEQWLDSLPAANSEEFKDFAEFTPSVIEFGCMLELLAIRIHSMI